MPQTPPRPTDLARRSFTPAPRHPADDDAQPGSLEAKLASVQSAVESAQQARDEVLLREAPESAPSRAPGWDRAQPTRRKRVTVAWRRRLTEVLVAADLVVATLAGAAGLALQGEPQRVGLSMGFALLFVAVLTLGRVYEHRFIGHGMEEYRRLTTAAVAFLALTAMAAYAVDLSARGLVLLGGPFATVGCLLVHVAVRRVLFALRGLGACAQQVVVIGLERSVAELARTVQADPRCGFRLVGACVSRSAGETVEGVPVLGTPDQAMRALRAARADTVVLTAWSDVSEQDLRRLSWDLEGSGIQLLVAPRLGEVAVPRMHLQTVGRTTLLTIDEPEFTGLRRIAKGCLDYGLAITALVLAAPLMLAVALAVRLTSPGPVFFRQERIGKNATTFRMTKFRSMYVDAEQRRAALGHLNAHGSTPLFKMKDDPRVTPVGRVIRRFSLDELPQLFDVLARSMSIVGPRPPLAREVAAYEAEVRRRLLVKPGITGLWQVSGRSDLSWEETVRLDLSYVENWSLGLDLSIIARTVVAVLGRKGAY